jgi:hypothetical protein
MKNKKNILSWVVITLLFLNMFATSAFANINGEISSDRYVNFGLYNVDNSLLMENTVLKKAENSKLLRIKGNYEAGDLVGKNVKISYSIDSVKDVIKTGILKEFTVDNINKNGTFDKPLTLKRGSTCTGDEICFPNGGSTYQLSVYITYVTDGEEQVYVYLKREINIESTFEEPFKFNVDDYEIRQFAGDFEAYVTDKKANKSISNQTYLFSDLNTPKEFNIEGHLKVKSDENNKVVIGYDVIDFNSYLNKNYKEGLVASYSQTEYAKGNYITFNKNFSLKMKSDGEIESNISPVNLLPKENRSYVIRVYVKGEDGNTKIEDFPFNVFENNLTAEEMEERANVDRELNKDLDEINDVGLDYKIKYKGSDLTNMMLTDLRGKVVDVELDGKFLSNLPEDKQFLVMYDITTIDDLKYIEENERVLKTFTQNQYSKETPVEFNRTLKFTVDDRSKHRTGIDYKPIIKLHDYPSHYILAVNVYFRDNETENYRHYKRLIKEFNVNGSKEDYEFIDEKSLKFDNPTKLDSHVKKYDESNNLINFNELNYDEIKANPAKINLEGIINNGVVDKNNITVKYEVTSYESYTKKSGTKELIKTFTQTNDTRLRNVEFNKDIYISTLDREEKSSDPAGNIVYLDTDTRYYTLRIVATDDTKGKVILQRDFTFLLNNGGEGKHEVEKPDVILPNNLSAFFIDKDGKHVETYELTARALNEAEEGVKLDLTGFVNKSWSNNEVKLNYDLVALDDYKSYLKNKDGEIVSLLQDPNNQTNINLPIASPMEEWLGKEKQLGFIKRYFQADYIKDKNEYYSKTFTLHTKLDKDKTELKNNDSKIFLDNVARNYLMKVTAENIGTGEISEKTINLNVTTEQEKMNTAPEFESSVSVISPRRGTGYFVDEAIPLTWTAAKDKENELMYYKIYYYYSTLDNTSGEIQNFMKRYDDMPKESDILSTFWNVDITTKIEPVYIKIHACDVNHVCSEETRSNPFKLNEFGIEEGGGNNGGGGSSVAIPVDISINPTGGDNWHSKPLDVSVFMNGDASLLQTANKRYEITQSPVIPQVVGKLLPASGILKLGTSGVYYVHAQLELDDGTKISKTSGPYKIDLGDVPNFNAKLLNKDGSNHVGWTKDDVILQANIVGTSLSGSVVEYMVGGHHNEWKPYKSGEIINVEGKKTVFVRVKDNSGKISSTIELTSMIDKNEAELESLGLIKDDKGNYSVEVKSKDMLSGIKSIKLNNGTLLNLTNSALRTYEINDLFVRPVSLTVEDNAGNVSKVHTFLQDIEVTYLTDKGSTTRDNFEFEFTGSGKLSYKIGNKNNVCSEDPCVVEVERNSNINLLSTEGYKFNRLLDKVSNIDKSPLRLIMSGERDLADETKAKLSWNHAVTGGELVCSASGSQGSYVVTGTSADLTVDNQTYSCRLKATVSGEEISSNTVLIYPDYSKEVTDGLDNLTKYGFNKIFIEEDRIGTTYFINTRSGDSKQDEVPLPDILLGK